MLLDVVLMLPDFELMLLDVDGLSDVEVCPDFDAFSDVVEVAGLELGPL